MNERIRELADQAELTVRTSIGTYMSHPEFNKKFAELIVKECMTICKQHPSRTLSNNWNADAVAPDIVHRFEEHFGVEE